MEPNASYENAERVLKLSYAEVNANEGISEVFIYGRHTSLEIVDNE